MSCACMTACMPCMQVEGLLPAHAVDLVKTGETAAGGVQFSLAAPAAAARGRCEAAGQTALGGLSGGERTLVSLALLLAVSLAASSCVSHSAQGASIKTVFSSCHRRPGDTLFTAHQCTTRNMLLYAGRICRSRQPLTDPGRGACILLHQNVSQVCTPCSMHKTPRSMQSQSMLSWRLRPSSSNLCPIS